MGRRSGENKMITIVEPKAELITPVEHLVDYSKLIEKAGRVCYKSESRTDSDSATKFIESIIKRGHLSVIEHCSITYKFVLSRAASHQLVRHRLCSFSQESQRFCDYGKLGFQVIVPPSIQNADGAQFDEFTISMADAYGDYLSLRDSGIPPEDARFVLPNACKTEVVTTCNLRNWRHIIKERGLNPHAQWEIRKVMKDILYELNHYLPIFFSDLVEEKE